MSGIVGQNTLDNSGLIKAPAGGGAWNFISKQTASSSADISFTSGIDSTYKEYIFTLNNIHPQTDIVDFYVNFSIDGGSNYDVNITSTYFAAYHAESGAYADVGYSTNSDVAEGTNATIADNIGADADQSFSGSMYLFSPSSTTFAKHWMLKSNYAEANACNCAFCAGYANTTSAVDAIQFKMSSGNIDAGDICLYGITT